MALLCRAAWGKEFICSLNHLRGRAGAALVKLPCKKELFPGILASLLTLAMEMEDNDGLLSGLSLP